ncbi:amino acid ABC transporter permease [Candidatus Dependentiae bacterium]
MIDYKMIKLLFYVLPMLLKGLIITLSVGFLASIIGFIGGLLFGVFNSNKLKLCCVSRFINFYVLLIRGTPLYVQVLIVYFVLPDALGINLTPFMAGVLALGCNSIAYVSEIIRSGINSIPDGQWDTSYLLGYSLFSTMRYVILPQMLKNVLPALTSELVVLIKDTSILSVIGLVEMTRIGSNINARLLQPMPVFLSLAFLYLIVTTTISIISKKIEKGLNYGDS